jgi:hypothetical protein
MNEIEKSGGSLISMQEKTENVIVRKQLKLKI